jgi:cell division protein FtsL
MQWIMSAARSLFTKKPAAQIASDNIEEYQRLQLEHEAAAEYHKKMAQYYSEGIVRLCKFRPVETNGKAF